MGNQYFENVKKNFDFGCMRLPMAGDEVDYDLTKQMIDAEPAPFMEQVFPI